ncbi:MAG: hypothetical protein JO251_04015 [Verrucomicrobia bacterium]|nr:hypothetical protein [Verrucomicrobiota bacterium]
MSQRHQLIGLDKPVTSPLSTAANPLTVLRDQASLHETHRLETVAETMALVGIMTFKHALSGREKVTVRGAIFQFGRGIHRHNTVAAHCLPGHLEFNSLPLHDMPDWNEAFLKERGLKPLALSSKLRNVCARTDPVDSIVNQTDSLLEIMRDGRGLKPTLERTVYGLMEHFLRRKPDAWPAVEDMVRESVNYYRLTAGYAYKERLDDLIKERGFATSNAQRQSINYKITVVEKYLEVLQDGSFVPEPTTLTGFLCVVKEVVEGYHY